jgi:hypothetical protein
MRVQAREEIARNELVRLQRLGHGVDLAGYILVTVRAALLEGEIFLDGEDLEGVRRRAASGHGLRNTPAVLERLRQQGQQLTPLRQPLYGRGNLIECMHGGCSGSDGRRPF